MAANPDVRGRHRSGTTFDEVRIAITHPHPRGSGRARRTTSFCSSSCRPAHQALLEPPGSSLHRAPPRSPSNRPGRQPDRRIEILFLTPDPDSVTLYSRKGNTDPPTAATAGLGGSGARDGGGRLKRLEWGSRSRHRVRTSAVPWRRERIRFGCAPPVGGGGIPVRSAHRIHQPSGAPLQRGASPLPPLLPDHSNLSAFRAAPPPHDCPDAGAAARAPDGSDTRPANRSREC
jgi:hypothetical protein